MRGKSKLIVAVAPSFYITTFFVRRAIASLTSAAYGCRLRKMLFIINNNAFYKHQQTSVSADCCFGLPAMHVEPCMVVTNKNAASDLELAGVGEKNED